MTVIDASVLVAGLVDSGPTGRWAESILGGSGLAAPELGLVETTNVLRRLEQSGRLGTPIARRALDDLLSLPLELYPFAPVAERVWELRPGMTAYDAGYVALAELLEAPLATIDLRITRSAGPRCLFRTPPH